MVPAAERDSQWDGMAKQQGPSQGRGKYRWTWTHTTRCMQHTQSGACKQCQLCMGMAMSTTPAMCPGQGHNIRLGPPESPGPPRMPSDTRTAGAAGTGRQSEARNGLKWEGATVVMQRQRRGWASGRGCGGCSGNRGACRGEARARTGTHEGKTRGGRGRGRAG